MAPAHADLLRLNDDRRLRSARGDEAAALSALTLRSKAYSNLTEPEAAAPSSLSRNVSRGYMRTTGVFADRQQDHAMMPDRPLHSRVVAVVFEAFVYFLDELGFPPGDFVITDPARLPPEIDD